MKPDHCLICGEANARTLFAYDAPDVYERAIGVDCDDYARAWVRCTSCGFAYSRYRRSVDIDVVYDDAYRNESALFRGESSRSRFERIVALPPEESEAVQRREMLEAILFERHPGLRARREGGDARRAPRLLDAGGGSGVFAYTFAQTGWRSEIVDPSPQGRFIEDFGVVYHVGRLNGAFPKTGYDLVTLNYVIEHVAEPDALLRDSRRVLGREGVVYVEAPDAAAFDRKAQDDDIFNSCHLWMFDRKSLAALLRRCSLEPLEAFEGVSPRGHFFIGMAATPV